VILLDTKGIDKDRVDLKAVTKVIEDSLAKQLVILKRTRDDHRYCQGIVQTLDELLSLINH